MENHRWIDTINISAMAMDAKGVIVDMNEKAAETFADDGGRDLLGKNLFDCHSKNSNAIIEQLLRDRATNVYTIGKKGKKKLIYQTPWYLQDGSVGGLVELSIVLPPDMPHFDRDE